jgi:hypothetical protein
MPNAAEESLEDLEESVDAELIYFSSAEYFT